MENKRNQKTQVRQKAKAGKKAQSTKKTKRSEPGKGKQEFQRPDRLVDKHTPRGEQKLQAVSPSPTAISRQDLKRAFILQELLFSKPLALRREK